jgi:hypothetical protein
METKTFYLTYSAKVVSSAPCDSETLSSGLSANVDISAIKNLKNPLLEWHLAFSFVNV